MVIPIDGETFGYWLKAAFGQPTTTGTTPKTHMDDVVHAIALCVARRATLAAETVLLIGEPEALSYDELQHSFMRPIHEESYEEVDVLGPIAKLGAWVEENILGQKPFIKPWMIDRANNHYALDISRAKQVLGWVPQQSLRKSIPKMVAALKADPLAFYDENELEPPEWMQANADATAQEQVT